MRVAIAGAGNVGRSIAAELVENGHEVLLIDKDPHAIKAETLTEAEWLLADHAGRLTQGRLRRVRRSVPAGRDLDDGRRKAPHRQG